MNNRLEMRREARQMAADMSSRELRVEAARVSEAHSDQRVWANWSPLARMVGVAVLQEAQERGMSWVRGV